MRVAWVHRDWCIFPTAFQFWPWLWSSRFMPQCDLWKHWWILQELLSNFRCGSRHPWGEAELVRKNIEVCAKKARSFLLAHQIYNYYLLFPYQQSKVCLLLGVIDLLMRFVWVRCNICCIIEWVRRNPFGNDSLRSVLSAVTTVSVWGRMQATSWHSCRV